MDFYIKKIKLQLSNQMLNKTSLNSEDMIFFSCQDH